ncbi:hypothetical protein CCMA1212_004778 [Trichoderma ghanense]|uniref:Uncharacterized protein n=1 Tax=Trichoderma ghanense TaxID=65468 RepID=A0ABY2H502_9HYPO
MGVPSRVSKTIRLYNRTFLSSSSQASFLSIIIIAKQSNCSRSFCFSPLPSGAPFSAIWASSMLSLPRIGSSTFHRKTVKAVSVTKKQDVQNDLAMSRFLEVIAGRGLGCPEALPLVTHGISIMIRMHRVVLLEGVWSMCVQFALLLGVGEAQLSRAESSVGNPSCLGEGVQQHIERRMKSEWAPIERRKFEIGPKWRKWENGRQNGHGGGRMGWQGIGGKGRTLGGGASTTSRGSSVTFDRMP